jgi:CPA2 family monovalent cation:H+ antiporter-2
MMTEAIQVIQDLAIVMVVALVMAVVSYWLRQPSMIGYIVAGMIVGPYTPPFSLVTHPGVLSLLAEVGIVFLLFAIGLEYPVARLRSVGRTALVIALVESLATFAAGFAVAEAFGFGEFASLFLGLSLSVTSTVILSRVLGDRGLLGEEVAGLVLAITVIEDVIVVAALGVLQSVAANGSVALGPLLVGVGLVVLFVVAALVLGSRAVPWLVDAVGGTGRSDLLLLAILGIAFGLSILSNLLGISVATGAFLAGVMVAGARNQGQARSLMAPLKELFGAIFFVSMGALMDIELLPAVLLPVLALLATAMGAKLLFTFVAARSQGVPRPAARRTAIGLAGPGGEVSLTVIKGGTDVAAVGPLLLPMVGAITLVTALLSPYRVAWAWRRRGPPEGPALPATESAGDP